MGRLKALSKSIVARLFRPAVWPLRERLDAGLADLAARHDRSATELNARLDQQHAEARTTHAAHDTRLARLEDHLERLTGWTLDREKHVKELDFWRWLVKTPEGGASVGGSYVETFGRWQRDRLRELAMALDLLATAGDRPRLDPAYGGVFEAPADVLGRIDAAIDQWCAQQRVVEIGGGPYPAIAAASAWRSAVAIDPIARRYAEEGLTPEGRDHIVFVESPGERTPLATASADLVIIENALDHVSDPDAVMAEIARLVRPEGLLWLLVDLSNYSDAMHPHPFNEARVADLLARHGFDAVAQRVSTHKSHPEAYGEFRGLFRRTADGTRTPHPRPS